MYRIVQERVVQDAAEEEEDEEHEEADRLSHKKTKPGSK